MAARTVIIGIGNLLLKDEGVGIHALREIREKTLPPGVEVLDGGTVGIGLLELLPGAGKVIFIDAAEMGLPPGTVVRFTPEEIRSEPKTARFSAHEVGLMDVLELAGALGQSPQEVVIIGIQPKEVSWGTDLSPEVQASLSRVVEIVIKELEL